MPRSAVPCKGQSNCLMEQAHHESVTQYVDSPNFGALAGGGAATPAPSTRAASDRDSPAPPASQARRPGQDIWNAAMALREEAQAPPSSTDGSSAFFDMARRPARGERQASTPSQQPRRPVARLLIRVAQDNRQGQGPERRPLPPPRPQAEVIIISSSDNEAAPQEDQAVRAPRNAPHQRRRGEARLVGLTVRELEPVFDGMEEHMIREGLAGGWADERNNVGRMPLRTFPGSRLLLWHGSQAVGRHYRLSWNHQLKYLQLMAHVQLLEVAESFARYPGREEEVEQAWVALLGTRMSVAAVNRAFAKPMRGGREAAHLRAPRHVEWVVSKVREMDAQDLRSRLNEQALHESITDYVDSPDFGQIL